jgi:molecular chaperone HscB
MKDYYELYDIERSFSPDAKTVRKKYLELSRSHHPDHFTHDIDAQKAILTLQLSADINKGYKTLIHHDENTAYLLKLEGVMQADESFALPADFLMEMMELNETVDEVADSDRARALTAEIEKTLSAYRGEIEEIGTGYASLEQREAELLRIKELYYKRKYLLRIRERLANFVG